MYKNMFLYEKTRRYLKNDYQFFDALKTRYRRIRGNYNLLTKVKFHELEWSTPLREFKSILIKVPRLTFGNSVFKFYDVKVFTWLLYVESCRITVESVLTPVRYKNHTEIYHSNVNKRPIWYKTCDDTVATTYMLS